MYKLCYVLKDKSKLVLYPGFLTQIDEYTIKFNNKYSFLKKHCKTIEDFTKKDENSGHLTIYNDYYEELPIIFKKDIEEICFYLHDKTFISFCIKYNLFKRTKYSYIIPKYIDDILTYRQLTKVNIDKIISWVKSGKVTVKVRMLLEARQTYEEIINNIIAKEEVETKTLTHCSSDYEYKDSDYEEYQR